MDGLNMHVREGALYGFVGPNGAGKTTTIKILTGLLLPDAGEVEIDGADALKNHGEVAEKIGYMPDFFGVYDNLKVCEYMELFASCYGLYGLTARKRAMALLGQVGLEEKADYYVDGLSRGIAWPGPLSMIPGSSLWMSPRQGWTPEQGMNSERL